MTKYFATTGLHEGKLEMEILIGSNIEGKEQAESIGMYGGFDVGVLYDDKMVIEGNEFTIRKDQTDFYQFRLCVTDRVFVTEEDYTDITWEEALEYLNGSDKLSKPFILESLYYGVRENHPFI